MGWKCYIAKDGVQQGPFSIRNLCAMWKRKEISLTDYYFIEGMESWLAIWEISNDLRHACDALRLGERSWKEAFEDTFIYQFPCSELVSMRPTERVPLAERWKMAGGKFYENRMLAWKRDDIWSRLGSSELFDDGLDVGHAPFVFGSGMATSDIDREESIDLGVIGENDEKMSDSFRERLKADAKQFDPELLKAFREEMKQEGDYLVPLRSSLSRAIADADEAYKTGRRDFKKGI
jgi:hypothetical protein